ncbi:hypothetical protein AB0L40_26490 [Patulibacter sp. NPDC049589]|uniref:hypothetical protein n=1 Tax=Patulibacter sp. NPDC049589 TaxID=3154731 RepID=UPI00342F38B5
MTRAWEDLDRLVDAVEARSTHLTSTIHGVDHWRAVGATAASLADASDMAAADADEAARPDRELLLLFALLHDSQRIDDGRDLEHGPRAALFFDELLAAGAIRLDDARAAVLREAIRDHTNGTLSEQPTIAVCWDADRLLIHRVGFVPKARFCSTPEARRRADASELPDLVGPPTWAEVAALLGVA